VRRKERHFTAATPHVRRFSNLGEHGAVWVGIAAAGAVADREQRGRWARAGLAVEVAHWGAVAVKRVIGRQRPLLEELPALIATPTTLSFPSAHAAGSFAAARAFGGLVPGPVLYPFAAAMALSRPYLGVHYPSDIAAGAVLGTVVGGVLR